MWRIRHFSSLSWTSYELHHLLTDSKSIWKSSQSYAVRICRWRTLSFGKRSTLQVTLDGMSLIKIKNKSGPANLMFDLQWQLFVFFQWGNSLSIQTPDPLQHTIANLSEDVDVILCQTLLQNPGMQCQLLHICLVYRTNDVLVETTALERNFLKPCWLSHSRFSSVM